ncbi:tyrosinase-like [Dunckerocampus dactyliophorus]|uniref:tyrosinase-like n=1 Tax=Dunckerocampus dactyliophorus TaxID=161453 RepID=UPI0024052ADA|nr:tyrosinase-like [Dunckerocampus dactyliophorus]
MWRLAVITFTLIWAPSLQQFPRPCATRQALLTKECCPSWEGDGSACGASSGRGFCQDVEMSDAPDGPQYPYRGVDDREKWPLVFFNRTCQCTGNFMGFNCGDCKFGYFGENCNEKRQTLRRNIFHLSRGERIRLVSYLNLAKQTVSSDYVVLTGTYQEMDNGSNPMFANVSVYDVFVWMHYYVSHDALLGGSGNVWADVDFAHWAPAFLPWHRVYLLHWEHEIRKLVGDGSFSIPYWDWRDAQGCDVCTDELMGGRSTQDSSLLSPGSIFSSWRVLCSQAQDYNDRGVLCDARAEGLLRRNPGNHNRNVVERLPTSADVAFTLSLANYDSGAMDRTANMSFRNTMEGFGDPQTGLGSSTRMGMHAALHVFMNGSMSSVQGSANDPIFLLHHAFVDSLYEEWLRRHSPDPSQYPSSNAPIGHNSGYYMVPFLPLHRNIEYFTSSKDLGYEYSRLLDATQRLSEAMRPYLEQLQDVWPWLLLAGLCGGCVSVSVAAAVLKVKRPVLGWRQLSEWRWKRLFTFHERQPLIREDGLENSKVRSYQMAM